MNESEHDICPVCGGARRRWPCCTCSNGFGKGPGEDYAMKELECLRAKLNVIEQAAKMDLKKSESNSGRLEVILEVVELAQVQISEIERQHQAIKKEFSVTQARLRDRNSEVQRLQDELFGWCRDREVLVNKVRQLQGKPRLMVDCDCGAVACGCINEAYRRAIKEEE